MPGLIPKTAFIGIDHVAHLATGGEAPVLRANLAAATQFLLDKGDGMPGRERFFVTADRTRAALARRLGGRPEDVAFLGSASEGLHVASEGIDWRPGDNVVVGQSEFPSVLLAWQRLRPRGVEVRGGGPRGRGGAGGDRGRGGRAHAGHRGEPRRLPHRGAPRSPGDSGPSRTGSGARLVVDASHALGVVPVDGTLCDVVVACCYKWVLAVHGVGVFYVNSRRWPELAAPWVGWHSTASRGRLAAPHRTTGSGRTARASRRGTRRSCRSTSWRARLRVLDALDPRAVEAHVLALGGTLRAGLVKLGLPVLTPEAPEERAGNIVFATDRCMEVERALRDNGVLVWAGDGRIRLSVHAYNDEADVARALAVLEDLTARGAV